MIKEIVREIRIVYIICVTVLLLMVGCEVDKPSKAGITEANFSGEWTMNTAFKDGKETKLLDNAFFKFDTVGNFSTNIQGDATDYPFKLSGNTIHVDGTKPNKYSVLKLTQDTLIMETRLRNFDFKFVTLRKQLQ